ncbi:MAG: hypothetical protein A2X97_12470 [Bdellovibrionales bacterium GWA1_52_35]|nr:MAG: hypothetical protein A2X97_12470 [Bdellovibrionales bacterium GWA1_52_35]HCM41662.1 hypothetical protein [Bdellovibrionales bacterium]
MFGVVILVSGCGKKNANEIKSVTGTASIVLGASTGAVSMQSGDLTIASLADGTWRLSPDQAKLTFTQIDFVSATQGQSVSATLSNCVVTYDRSLQSGANLLDCPFTLQLTSEDGGVSYKGTYVGVYLYFKTTIPVLLNGALGGIYSDPASPTKLSAGSNAGQYVDYQLGGGTGAVATAQVYFATPFLISDTETPTIRVITDMIHTISGEVTAGVPSFNANAGERPVELMAVPGGETGSSEFYSTATTIESTPQLGTDGQDYLFARVFYSGANPVFVSTSGYLPGCSSGSAISQAYAVNPATAPLQDSSGNKAGGFLGLSAAGDISWALASSYQWTQYESLFVMQKASAIGQGTDLKCQATTAIPQPADGVTYRSGTPAITPSHTFQVKLLAK